MTDQLRHITELFYRQLRGETLDPQEAQILKNWAAQSAYTQEVSEILSTETRLNTELRVRLSENYSNDYQKIKNAIDAWKQKATGTGQAVSAHVDTEKNIRPVHRVHFLKTAWFRYAAVV